MRTIDSTTQANIDSGKLETAHLIEINLNHSLALLPTVIYVTEFAHDIDYASDTYSALGHLLTISNLDQTNDLQIQNATLTFSGIDGVYVSYLFNYEYIDREIVIHRAFLSGGSIVGEPVKLFEGRLNQPTIQDNPEGETIVSLSASSYLSDFDRKPARHTNHVEQSSRFEGDTFFKNWGVIDRDIIWGRET